MEDSKVFVELFNCQNCDNNEQTNETTNNKYLNHHLENAHLSPISPAQASEEPNQTSSGNIPNTSEVNISSSDSIKASKSPNFYFSEKSRQSGSRNRKNQTFISSHEDLDTKEIASNVASHLKRYSIPQAVFAERVLGRSQGTLSDLLRNPKPWSQLKSGREPFLKMSQWLREPESKRLELLLPSSRVLLNTPGVKRKLQDLSSQEKSSPIQETECEPPKVELLDYQRQVLRILFKAWHGQVPSEEMQAYLAHVLNLDSSTVNEFFLNANNQFPSGKRSYKRIPSSAEKNENGLTISRSMELTSGPESSYCMEMDPSQYMTSNLSYPVAMEQQYFMLPSSAMPPTMATPAYIQGHLTPMHVIHHPHGHSVMTAATACHVMPAAPYATMPLPPTAQSTPLSTTLIPMTSSVNYIATSVTTASQANSVPIMSMRSGEQYQDSTGTTMSTANYGTVSQSAQNYAQMSNFMTNNYTES